MRLKKNQSLLLSFAGTLFVMTSFYLCYTMNRKIRLKSVGSKTVDGVSAVRLVAARDTFNFTSSPSSSSSCFVPSVLDSPLPPGAMDLAPCYEGAPIMASFPYFLHADQW